MALRTRMLALPPGTLLEVTARDLGAPEDLPSWCRLTGHELVAAEHPVYLIRRRTAPERSPGEAQQERTD